MAKVISHVFFRSLMTQLQHIRLDVVDMVFILPLPKGGGGYTILPLSDCPSVQDIFRRTFLSNC